MTSKHYTLFCAYKDYDYLKTIIDKGSNTVIERSGKEYPIKLTADKYMVDHVALLFNYKGQLVASYRVKRGKDLIQ